MQIACIIPAIYLVIGFLRGNFFKFMKMNFEFKGRPGSCTSELWKILHAILQLIYLVIVD